MIRLNYSGSGVQTVAFWTDYNVKDLNAAPGQNIVPAINLTSSYTQETFSFTGSITTDNTTQYGGWLLCAFSQSDFPTASGQYFGDLTIVSQSFGLAIWNITDLLWNETNFTWEDIDQYRPTTSSYIDIADERIWVSGSNDPSFTDYVSSNENATFNAYQN